MSKRQLAWQWMKEQDSFSASEVADAVEMDLEQCRTTINKFKEQGFVNHVSGIGVPGRAKRYSVNKDACNEPRFGKGAKPGDTLKRQGRTGQQLIWNTLRINRIVTVSTVVAVTQCPHKSVMLYLRNLEKAGYVTAQKVDTRKSNREIAGHETCWKLKAFGSSTQPGETGPKAPMLRKGVGMFDQNTQTLHHFKGTNE